MAVSATVTKVLGKVGITFGGEWNSTTTYEELIFVNNDGSGYISKTNVSAGIEPGVTAGWETYWQLACEKGDTGTGEVTRQEFDDLANSVGTVPVGETVEGQIADLESSKADIITVTTSSAPIVSIPDGGNGYPMDSVEATIAPVQDLHGYSNPWPAGGGKNILDPNIKFTTQTVRGVTLTTTDGYNFSISGTGESGSGNIQTNNIPTADCIVYPAGTYTVTGMIIGTYHTDDSWYSNRGGTFTSPEDFIIKNGYREIATGTTYNVNEFISMTKGTTALTAWTPYSNICPISGWSEAKVNRTGRNLLDFTVKNMANVTATKTNGTAVLTGTANGTSYPINFVATLLPAGTYVWSVSGLKTDMRFDYSKDGSWAGVISNGTTITLTKPTTIAGYLRVENGAATNTTVTVQLQVGSVASDFTPYIGTSVTVSLGQTVYGGTLDVVSGVLTVDRASVDLGTLDWYYGTLNGAPYFFAINFTDAKKPPDNNTKANILCSALNCVTANELYSGTSLTSIIAINTQQAIQCRDTRYSDAPTFTTAMSGVQLVYELATPVTVSLTANEISTLLGDNNVWSTTGDTAITYKADTKLYIDNKIADAIANALNS